MTHASPHLAESIQSAASRSDAEAKLVSTIRDSRILVVDDQRIVRELLKVYLNAGGYRNLLFAEDGDQALELIAAEEPDLMILDLQMPRMNGYEVCEAVRNDPKHSDLPVLVQTAADSPEDRARVFRSGATDMVGKPINDAELLARVGIHLQNLHMLRQLSIYRSSMERELEAARRMQHGIMPGDDKIAALEKAYGIEIRHLFQTCDALGGDMWNVWRIDDGHMGFSCIDFTGHGVVASLNTFRFQSLTLTDDVDPHYLGEHSERLNRRLNALLQVGQFATAIGGVIDFEDDVVRYVGAGGPRPFLLLPGEERGRFIESDGRPLGMTPDAKYPVHEVPFPPGSMLFMYSDALTETPSMANPVCSEARIAEILGAPPGGGAHPFDRLVDDFYSRLQDPLKDDLTMVMLRRPLSGKGEP
jgi:sigma-B regulation protein RsbU (phosphoserine phosphatase)